MDVLKQKMHYRWIISWREGKIIRVRTTGISKMSPGGRPMVRCFYWKKNDPLGPRMHVFHTKKVYRTKLEAEAYIVIDALQRRPYDNDE